MPCANVQQATKISFFLPTKAFVKEFIESAKHKFENVPTQKPTTINLKI